MKQFLTVREASEELGLSASTIRKMIAEIRSNIPGRYSRTDIFEGKVVAVRFAALQDWAETKQRKETGLKPGPYEPLKRERELGIIAMPTQLSEQIDTEALADALMKKMARMFARQIV